MLLHDPRHASFVDDSSAPTLRSGSTTWPFPVAHRTIILARRMEPNMSFGWPGSAAVTHASVDEGAPAGVHTATVAVPRSGSIGPRTGISSTNGL